MGIHLLPCVVQSLVSFIGKSHFACSSPPPPPCGRWCILLPPFVAMMELIGKQSVLSVKLTTFWTYLCYLMFANWFWVVIKVFKPLLKRRPFLWEMKTWWQKLYKACEAFSQLERKCSGALLLLKPPRGGIEMETNILHCSNCTHIDLLC